MMSQVNNPVMKLPKIHQNVLSKYLHENPPKTWTGYKLPAITKSNRDYQEDDTFKHYQQDSDCQPNQEKTILSGAVVEKKIRLRPDLTQWDLTSPRRRKSQASSSPRNVEKSTKCYQPTNVKNFNSDRSTDGSFVNEELLRLYNFVIQNLLRALGPYAKLFIQLQTENERQKEFIQIAKPLKLHRRGRYRFRKSRKSRSNRSDFEAYNGYIRRKSSYSSALLGSSQSVPSAQSFAQHFFIPSFNLESYDGRTIDQLYNEYIKSASSRASQTISHRSFRPSTRDSMSVLKDKNSNVPRFIGDFLLAPPPTERSHGAVTPPASVNGTENKASFRELSENLLQEVAESELRMVPIARRQSFPGLQIENTIKPKRDIVTPTAGILTTGNESVLASLYEKHVVPRTSSGDKNTTSYKDEEGYSYLKLETELNEYSGSGSSDRSSSTELIKRLRRESQVNKRQDKNSASSGMDAVDGYMDEGEEDSDSEEEAGFQNGCKKYVLPADIAPKRAPKKPTVPMSPFSQNRPKIFIPQHKLPEIEKKETTKIAEFKKAEVTDKPWLKKPFELKKRPTPPEVTYSSSSIKRVRDDIIDSVILGELINEEYRETVADVFRELLADVANGVEIEQAEVEPFGMLGEVFFETVKEMKEHLMIEEAIVAEQEEITIETLQELLGELITEVIEDPTEPATEKLSEDILDEVVTEMIREVAKETRDEARDLFNTLLSKIITDVCNECLVDELQAKLGEEAIELSMSIQTEAIEEMIREVCEEAILEEEKDIAIMGVINDMVDELIRQERRNVISEAMAKARREIHKKDKKPPQPKEKPKIAVPPVPALPPTPEPVEPLATFPRTRFEMEVPPLPEFEEKKVPVRKVSKKTSIVFAPKAQPEEVKVKKRPPKLRRKMISQFPLSKFQKRQVKEEEYEYDEQEDFYDPLEFLAKYCIINTDFVPRYEAIYMKVVKERQAKDKKRGVVHPPKGKLSHKEQIERLDFSLDIYHQKAIEMQQEVKKAKEEQLHLQSLLDSEEHINKELRRRKLERLKRRMRRPTEYIRIPKDYEVEEKIRQEINEKMKSVANKSYKAKSVYDEFMRRVEKLYVERHKVIERIKEGHTTPIGMSENIEEILQEKEPDMDVIDLAKALRMLHNNDITDKEIEFIKNVLDIPGRPNINFKFFTIIAALSERITSLDDLVKNLINSMSARALEIKMERCKEMFFLLADSNPDFLAESEVSINSLATELAAGGLTKEHENMVRQRFNRNGRGTVNFLDFITYIPLFVHIHDKIISDPLTSQRNL